MFGNRKKGEIVRNNHESFKDILALINKYENSIYKGEHQLSLTVDFLNYYQNLLDRFNLHLPDNLVRIREFFKRIESLRLTHGVLDPDDCPKLCHFESLTELILIGVDLESIEDIALLRPQLRTVHLKRSFTVQRSPELDFQSAEEWPVLEELAINSTPITKMNVNSLVNTIVKLDLSWNRLQQIDVSGLPTLCELDLSFNCLTSLPVFVNNSRSSNSVLKVLRLKSNLISNLNGLQNLNGLIFLDLSYNCLLDRNQVGPTFFKCLHLENLDLRGNPNQFKHDLVPYLVKFLPNLTVFNGQRYSSALTENDITYVYSKPVEKAMIFQIENDQVSKTLTPSGAETPVSSEECEVISKKKSIPVRNTVLKNLEAKKATKNMRADVPVILEISPEKSTQIDDLDEIISPETVNSSIKDLKLNLSNSLSGSMRISGSQNIQDLDNGGEEGIEIIEHPNESDDENGDENSSQDLFLVEKDSNQYVFLRVKDSILIEKDGVTCSIIANRDLSVLFRVEYFVDEPLKMKLFFKTRIRELEEVVYCFEYEADFDRFRQQYVYTSIELYERRLAEDLKRHRNLMECLKCGMKQVVNGDGTDEIERKCPCCQSEFVFFLSSSAIDDQVNGIH